MQLKVQLQYGPGAEVWDSVRWVGGRRGQGRDDSPQGALAVKTQVAATPPLSRCAGTQLKRR